MKYTIVPLSEVQKGNMCMLANRFLDECGECYRVTRCRNEQAIRGRVQLFEKKRLGLMDKIDEVDKKLKMSRWEHLKFRLRNLFRKESR